MKHIKILGLACVLVSVFASVAVFAGGNSGDVQYQGDVYTGKGTVPTTDGSEITYTGKIIYYKDCVEGTSECTVNVRANGQGSVKINNIKIDYRGTLIYSQHYVQHLQNGVLSLDVSDSIFTDGDGSYNIIWIPYTWAGVTANFAVENKGIIYSCEPYENAEDCNNIDYFGDIEGTGVTSIPYTGQLTGQENVYILYKPV